jgi:hypothetical protein
MQRSPAAKDSLRVDLESASPHPGGFVCTGLQSGARDGKRRARYELHFDGFANARRLLGGDAPETISFNTDRHA